MCFNRRTQGFHALLCGCSLASKKKKRRQEHSIVPNGMGAGSKDIIENKSIRTPNSSL